MMHATKKTFNIKNELIKQMESLIPSRKQTEFVNKAIEELLEQAKKEKAKQRILKMIDEIKPIKIDRPILDVLKEIREERSNFKK